MASNTILHKLFNSFKGLDLRTSDLLRSEQAATSIKNMDYRQTGAMNKRRGYQNVVQDNIAGGYGITTFNDVNTTTGAVTEQLISVDDNLNKLQPYSFNITYNGVHTSVYYTMSVNSTDNKFYFEMYDDQTRVLNFDCGTGVETSPTQIGTTATADTLVKAINDAVVNTTATVNGTQASVTTITVDSGHDIIVNDVATIPITGGGTSSKTITARTDTSITFVGAISVDDNAAITAVGTGNHFTCSNPTGGSTAPAATVPVFKKRDLSSGSAVQVVFEVWEDVSLPGTYTTPFSTFYGQRTNADFENATFAEINNILYIATGHDVLHKYDGGLVYKAGLPQASTPTLNSITTPGTGTFTAVNDMRYKVEIEHTDAKGNIIYSEISSHLEVTTLALTTNNVVLDFTNLAADSGYDVDTRDYGDGAGAIKHLKYNIYRTDDSDTASDASSYYLIGTVSHGTTQFTDTGIAEGAVYVDPIKQRGLPPSCRYVDTWRGQLIMAGDLANVTTVYYSDVDSPEYFPSADNSFTVDRKITGLKSLDNILYVFQKHNIDGVSGDFGSDNFQVDKVSRSGIGCSAHATIQEVESRLFFLSDQGVFSISPEGVENVGSAIEPKFQKGNNFTFKQATAYNWQADKKYVLFMPNLPVDASYSDDAENEIYVYDYFRTAWLEWDNFNLMGGMTEKNDVIYFASRTTDVLLHAVLDNGNEYDYADHVSAISFSYKSHWITMGEPSMWKKFLRCKIHSYDTSLNDFELDTFDVTLKTEHDYNTATTRTNISYDFGGGALGWGLGPWGDFPWGELRLTQLKKKIASKKSRSMRVIFENSTINENVLISGYELEVVVPYKPGLKE